MPTPTGQGLPQEMLDCIEVCNDCHKACLQTAMYCLQQSGAHAQADHVRLMLDCAEICQASANFMQRGSPLHTATCTACARVCGACAADCEKMSDDSRMTACATMCRRCEKACARMSKTM